MEQAYEKACQAFEAKQAAKRVQQGGPAVVEAAAAPLPGAAPSTPGPKEGLPQQVGPEFSTGLAAGWSASVSYVYSPAEAWLPIRL